MKLFSFESVNICHLTLSKGCMAGDKSLFGGERGFQPSGEDIACSGESQEWCQIVIRIADFEDAVDLL